MQKIITTISSLILGIAPWSAETLNLPVVFELKKASTVTIVIEDAQGKRVRNLAGALRLAAGKNLLSWDGYDDGEVQKDGSIVRRKVAPGTYVARGVTSDGLRLIYEFPFNSPGTPPWFTPERNGAWLADHTAAQGIVFAPASDDGFLGRGQSRVIATALTAECGDAFMALDLDGKKLLGSSDFGWHGGYALALDRGPEAPANPDSPWLYALRPEKKNVTLNAYSRNGKATRFFQHTSDNPIRWCGGQTGDSVAAWNGRVVVSVPHDHTLLLFDSKASEAQRLVGKIPFNDPRGVLFDEQGRLLVAGAKHLKRLTLDPVKARVIREETVVSNNLEDAQQLARDKSGNLYVGDWGKEHVVKVFTPEGKPLRRIGKPGGPQLGKGFDYERLHWPKGLAIDDRDQLWIVNADHIPKRISVWSLAENQLVNSFIGGPGYGGGGTLDPEDRTKLYYGLFNGGYTMKLDWEKGSSVVDGIYTRLEQFKGLDRDKFVGQIPQDAFHLGEHTFLIANYTPGLSWNNMQATIWHRGKDGIAWPVGMVGGPMFMETSHGSWNPTRNPGMQEFFDNPGDGKKIDNKTLLIWSDLNRDGRASPAEFKYWRTMIPYVGQNVRFNKDLSFTLHGQAFPAPKVLANGVPVWPDTAKLTPVTGEDVPYNSSTSEDGWTLDVGRDFRGTAPGRHNSIIGYRNNQRMWEYPSLDGTHIPTNPGDVVMAQRHLGAPFKVAKGEAGTIFGINGEKGSMYLMTADGLFLQDVGADMRTHPTPGVKYTESKRGMVMEGVSFHDEHYGPGLSQTKNGEVILIAGKEYSAIFRVDGLQNVKRRTFATLEIPASLLAGMSDTQVIPARQKGRQSLDISSGGTPPVVDGDLTEWGEGVSWAKLDDRASAALRIAGDRLYAAWKTGDPNALKNATGDPKFLFKRGGAVDLMIGRDAKASRPQGKPIAGDLRLLVTQHDGKPTAVIYRPVVPGTAETARIPFESPVGRVDFDRVDVVSDRIQLAQRGGDIELSVPLASLGLENAGNNTTLLGDIGILRGTGAITTQRLYWNNLDTAICSDIPSEAKLAPHHWGTWRFVPH